jgi:hypothetical protein
MTLEEAKISDNHSLKGMGHTVWVSLIRLFSTRFLGKLTEVVSQKFAQLEKPVSKIISALIVI